MLQSPAPSQPSSAASPAPPATPQATPWIDVFQDAVIAVFRQWTVIQLACSQEWVRNPRDRVNDVLEHVWALVLNKKCRPMTAGTDGRQQLQRMPAGHPLAEINAAALSNAAGDISKLATLLRVRMYELLNAEMEDGSDVEVATIVLRLLDGCKRNDVGEGSYAQQILVQGNPAASSSSAQNGTGLEGVLAACKGTDATEFVDPALVLPEDGGEGWNPGVVSNASLPGMGGGMNTIAEEDDDMEVEDGGASSSSAAPTKPAAPAGPQYDADGFEIVSRRR